MLCNLCNIFNIFQNNINAKPLSTEIRFLNRPIIPLGMLLKFHHISLKQEAFYKEMQITTLFFHHFLSGFILFWPKSIVRQNKTHYC